MDVSHVATCLSMLRKVLLVLQLATQHFVALQVAKMGCYMEIFLATQHLLRHKLQEKLSHVTWPLISVSSSRILPGISLSLLLFCTFCLAQVLPFHPENLSFPLFLEELYRLNKRNCEVLQMLCIGHTANLMIVWPSLDTMIVSVKVQLLFPFVLMYDNYYVIMHKTKGNKKLNQGEN